VSVDSVVESTSTRSNDAPKSVPATLPLAPLIVAADA
jgi:hypothetical protein